MYFCRIVGSGKLRIGLSDLAILTDMFCLCLGRGAVFRNLGVSNCSLTYIQSLQEQYPDRVKPGLTRAKGTKRFRNTRLELSVRIYQSMECVGIPSRVLLG